MRYLRPLGEIRVGTVVEVALRVAGERLATDEKNKCGVEDAVDGWNEGERSTRSSGVGIVIELYIKHWKRPILGKFLPQHTARQISARKGDLCETRYNRSTEAKRRQMKWATERYEPERNIVVPVSL